MLVTKIKLFKSLHVIAVQGGTMVNLRELLRIKKQEKNSVLHLAVNAARINEWSENTRVPLQQAYDKALANVKMLLKYQREHDIPILTVRFADSKQIASQYLTSFFQALAVSEEIHKNQMRIFVIGKWYECDQDFIESIKQVMAKTAEYDKHFVNFCIAYDGQDELLSAMKLVARKVIADKLSVEEITYDVIKEQLYSSYFTPPDVIVETDKSFSGLLLWDSPHSYIHFLSNYFTELSAEALDTILSRYKERLR